MDSARTPAHELPLWIRLALVPLVAALLLLGIWVTGGRITDNFRVAMVLTGLWFGLAGLAALVVAWRRRPLALAVLGTYVITAVAAGGYLAYASMVDKVVSEQVAVAAAPASSAGQTPAPSRNAALAHGSFTSGEHETTGKATLIRLGEGGTVLTLTDFETSPGPDLRVYLVTGSADQLGDVVDLGHLRGNKGNQQYAVPARVDTGKYRTVVVWCRAFSVAFGSVRLA
jgi:hypothetical protein